MKDTDLQNTEKKTKKPGRHWAAINILGLLFLFIFIYYFYNITKNTKEINWDEFAALIKNQKVDKIIIVNNEMAKIYVKTDSLHPSSGEIPEYVMNIGTPEVFEEKVARLEETNSAGNHVAIQYVTQSNWLKMISIFIFPLLLFFLVRRSLRGNPGMGSLFSFGQSGARLFENNEKDTITFENVAGLDEVKEEMEEIVDFLKDPQSYTKLGAKIPKGILLIGPPGTGKTLLARAVAGEAKVSFFSLSGSEFVEMFVGIGASRVRDLFKKAKEKAPCIIFIDEIDAIGRTRSAAQSFNANDERENTLNQLLAEMDGFSVNSGVIVLAATNRGEILDRALLRPGRFDRHIYLELPDLRERKEIFIVHMKPLILDDSVDADLLATQTPGFSGADIANICNEAALIAARKKKIKISKEDFSDAVDRIVGGLEKRKKIISEKERRIIAFHEAGHALATCYLKDLKEVIKVSIIPRGKSLGAAWYRPEELQLVTLKQLSDEISIMLAGRAAEEVMFNEITSGALDDLEKATKQAYGMIAFYGLGKKTGNLSFYNSEDLRETPFQKPYSEETAKLIDEEVRDLVADCYEKAKKLLVLHKRELDQVGRLLLEKEIIYREDLERVIRNSPIPG